MRANSLRVMVLVLTPLVASATWALGPSAGKDQAARLEVKLGRVRAPTAEILGWELTIDGARVVPDGEQWAGTFQPGPHSIGVRVHYSHQFKAWAQEFDDGRIGFTFVSGGPRWLAQDYAVDARPASVVRIAATLDVKPQAIADLLVVDGVQERALADCGRLRCTDPLSARPADAPAPGAWHGEFDISRLVQQRADHVAALLSPQLVRAAGREGEARVRFAVDARGYLREAHLEASAGAEALDASVEEVLRLAEPYPAFEGFLTVALSFTTARPAPTSPLATVPAYRRLE